MKTIIGNWKMNLGVRESVALARASLLLLRGKKTVPDFVICPSFIALPDVHKIIARSSVSLGAQNISTQDQGAMTGEISARMLDEVGVTHVIIGHSERKFILGETDELINQKIINALEHHLVPIVCVGETDEEHSRGEQKKSVTHELAAFFKNVSLKRGQKIIIAYEPIWAIGTGQTPEVQETVEMHKHIREVCNEIFSSSTDDQISILYGGSVDGKNAYKFLREPVINGVLVGGASIKINQITQIIDAAAQVLHALS